MSISLEKAYFYLVSLITLVMSLFFIISLVNSGIDYLFPYSYAKTIPDADLRREYVIEKEGGFTSETELEQKAQQISEEELKEFKETRIERDIAEMRRSSLRSMLNSVIALIIVLPVYFWHFRKARMLS